ncbi:MAG: DUF72 domain-containing protein [bacterium]|nr:DUF72 domain-containing protein [bacterium]
MQNQWNKLRRGDGVTASDLFAGRDRGYWSGIDLGRMEQKIGCCGFPVARDRYYQYFDVVELQRTFYQPPDLPTIQKLRECSPPGFEFSLKAWQLITHPPTSPTYRKLRLSIPKKTKKNYGFFKPTDEVLGAWRRVDEISQVLEAKVIVFQCPASFTPTQENKKNLRRFFLSIKRRNYTFCWELRGEWADRDVESLCKELDLVHCVDPFKSEPTFGKIRYFRLHGIGGYRYRYTEDDLRNLKAKDFKSPRVYYMFNNVYMFEDARRFKEMMSRLIL